MGQSEPGWWGRHGWTVVILLAAFSIAFVVRTLWVLPIYTQWGPTYLFAGGSDSFYHWRVSQYIIQNHRNLILDPLLRYPTGAINPREPLFDWMNAILGIVFAPLFGGSALAAGRFFLELQAPLWAALGVFPVYLIGKEVFNRRAGLIAALLFAFVVANIDSSTFGYANYLSFYTFFILVTVYAYLRTVRAAGTRRWVENYRDPRSILAGLRAFVRTERLAVKWAVFTGVAFGTVALAWQGYSFVVAAIVVFLVVAMLVERIRRVDPFGAYVTTWIVGLVGFPLAFPYYIVQQEFAGWFDLPLLVFFGALLVLLPFLLLRDTPWVVSVPVLVGTVAAAVAGLAVLNHAFFVNIVTGQGYFVKTLVYSTVAEAQAPSVDALILGYGVVTFFLAFVGLALTVYRTARERVRRTLLLFLVFAIVSIYLPITAAKFFFIGSPAFALLSAVAIERVLDVGGYPTLRRNVAALSDRRSQLAAFRRAFKARHVLVMALVVVIVLPNVWYSIDAGIPYNSKTQYNQQIYNSLPPPLRTSSANAGSYYLGAAGSQLDTPSQYDEAGYDWLAQQDPGLPAPQRPAFVSWWDYGFQAVSEGAHPTVADNFQNGIVPGGNFLLAQNESQAIAILATDLLTAEQHRSGDPYLPQGLNAVMARDGVNLTILHSLLVNQSTDVQMVLAHPERYLPVDPTHLDGSNAMYDTIAYYLATALGDNGVAQVYDDIQAYTGWSIRYAMVDSRLFPFSGQNTGIFYAPADLTDRIIGPGGAPTTYFTVSVVGSDGNTYPVGQVPAGVTPVSYNINRLPPFYNSMIYRTFIGYNGTDVGQGPGIPGIEGSVGSDPVEPGWMLQHFQVVYRTAYYCDQPNAPAGSSCFRAMNLPSATALAKKTNGTADTSSSSYFGGGESILEYFPGQPMVGSVQLPDGTPVANARVTVYDAWGIPHMTTLTSSTGAYSVVLPPGNDTVNVTTGHLDGLSQAGTTHLATIHLHVSPSVALSFAAPTLLVPVTLQPAQVRGFVYWNTANNSSYVPRSDALVAGATVILWGAGEPTLTTTTDASGAFNFPKVAPGVYNFSVLHGGANFTSTSTPVFADPGKVANQTTGLSPGSLVGTVRLPDGSVAVGAQVTVRTGVGTVAGSAVSNATGGFLVRNLGPGNFTATAELPSLNLGSAGLPVQIAAIGVKATANLTLAPVVSVVTPVVYDGSPVPGLPVRFTLLVPPGLSSPSAPTNNSTRPGTPQTAANANSTVVVSGPDGVVRATLPAGNYSVYAFGLSGTGYLAGFSTAYLSGHSGVVTIPPIFLGPAETLSGNVSLPPGSPSLAAPTQVIAFNERGSEVWGFTNSSHQYTLWLPPGNYSVLAVQGAGTSAAPALATLETATVNGPTRLALSLAPAVVVRARVGATLATPGSFFAASGAPVQFSLVPGGARVTVLADRGGNLTTVLPASLPAGGSYCLNVTAFGFEPFGECGLAPSSLQTLGTVPLTLAPSSVRLSVLGLPTGANLTVNFTAENPTARSQSLLGGTTFSTTLAPGAYRLTAWARPLVSPGLYLPASPLNFSIPLGAVETNLTLTVYHQVEASGPLVLPSGVTNTSATVRLTGPSANLTMSGAAFESRFYLPPGTYTVYASAAGASGTFANLTTVVVNQTGAFSHPVDLTSPATTVSGIVAQPNGSPLNASFPVTLRGPMGLAVPTTATSGRFSVPLPPNESYALEFNTTDLVPTPTGEAYVTFTAPAGFTCAATGAASPCDVTAVARVLTVNVTGDLTLGGSPTGRSASVEFVGPSPHSNATFASVQNGTFQVDLVPGNYTVYATAGSGTAVDANLSQVTVTPTLGPLSLALSPTWTDSVSVVPPSASGIVTATLTLRGPSGAPLTVVNVPVNTPQPYALPVGTYVVSASAPASPYGVSANATANATVMLVGGNAGTVLRLAYAFPPSVRFSVVGSATDTLGNGGVATFAYVVTNTGSAPVNVTLSGSPSLFPMNFSASNFTLGVLPGTNSVSGVVTIRVPAGTAVAHPPVILQALVGGQVVATASPTPTIDLTPYTGLSIGSQGASSSSVGALSATLPFYVLNTGNIPESVSLSVADASRLLGLGWSTAVLISTKPLAGPTSVAAGANESFQVRLTAPSGHAVPPGTVTVLATVENLTGGLGRTATLPVPTLALSLNSSQVVVTGPGVGSPPAYPDWFVPLLSFLPAIALVVGLVTYRWWKTRRWTRR